MNETPEKAGERPCWPSHRPTRGNRVGQRGSIPTFSPKYQTVFGGATWQIEAPCRLKSGGGESLQPLRKQRSVRRSSLTVRSNHLTRSGHRSADLGTKAAATLWSASGGVPAASGAAAATRDRRDRERPAVRFAVEAVACGALGCRRSDGLLELRVDGDQRVLCPAHARRWST